MKASRSPAQAGAVFQVELVDGVVCIMDLGDTAPSVTNRAGDVIRAVSENYDLSAHRVIYADSTGRWDGLRTLDDVFAGVVPIDAATREEAIRIAHDGTRWTLARWW